MINAEVEHWSSNNGQVYLEETQQNHFLRRRSCFGNKMAKYRKPQHNRNFIPGKDFMHFTGDKKPWTSVILDHNHVSESYRKKKRGQVVVDLDLTLKWEDVVRTEPTHFWFYVLRKVNDKLNMNLDFANLSVPKRSVYGTFPVHHFLWETIKAKINGGKAR